MKNINIENNQSIKENNLGLRIKKTLVLGLVSVNLLFVGVSGVSATPHKKWTEEELQRLTQYVEKYKDTQGKVTWNQNELEKLFPDRSIASIANKYSQTIKTEDEKTFGSGFSVR